MGEVRGEAEAIRTRLWGEKGSEGQKPGPAHKEVRALIDEYPGEEVYFLDFKSGVELFPNGSLDRDAVKAVLSKAVSAFGNTRGGVIVWGVTDWERNPKRRPKPEQFPVDQARILEEYLRRVQTSVTLPEPPDVRHRLIERPRGNLAFVATFVGRNEGPPLQARHGKAKGRYCRRRSDGSRMMTHDEIADMFGRRPHPDLELKLRVFRTHKSSSVQHFRVQFGLTNEGRGIALYPALFVTWDPKGSYQCSLEVFEAAKPGLPIRKARSRDFDLELVGGVSDPIHHGTYLPVVDFTSSVNVAGLRAGMVAEDAVQAFKYKVEIHCAEAPAKRREGMLDPASIIAKLDLLGDH